MGRYKALQIFLIFFLTVHRGCVLSASSYYYSRYTANWDDAKLDCENIGGFLVKFDDMDELTDVSNKRNLWLLSSPLCWCGLKDIDGSNTHYHWLDGTPITDTSMWHSGEPNGASHHCGYMGSNNRIADGSCGSKLSFICEVDEGSALAQSKADLRSCYVGNDLLRPVRDAESYELPRCPRGKIYFCPSHWKNFMTWSQADAYCKLANANLAKITSADEQLMVNRFREVKGFSNNYWIGGTDSASEGLYTWADGELVGGDGGWPSFPTTTEPAADLTRNCVATGGTGAWYMASCGTKYPVLCEIDADLLPNHQSCYWKLAPTRPTTHSQQCANAGGNLANIKTMTHFERMLKLVDGNHLNIGMSDLGRTWDQRWMDGSMVMWAKWYGPNTEPNSLNELYIEYWYTHMAYNDRSDSGSNDGLCEKPVFQFEDADILHVDGAITVTCHEPCVFQDGMITKTWSCADVDVTSVAQGCICEDGFWTILEPWLSHLNTSVVQDNDTDTCITIQSTIYIFTLSYSQSRHGSFDTEVILPPDIEQLRSDIIHVFTSTDLSFPEATCRLSGPLTKCRNVSGSKYACTCRSSCHVYVKLFQTKETMLPLSVCEIRVVYV